MGLPSGTKWAKSNIDLSQENKFANSPEQYACSFFSWGNIDGHNPISESAFEYDWGGVNEQAPWYEGQPYGGTPGAAIQDNIDRVHDAARRNLGWPWRMPTAADLNELFDAANTKFINADGTEIDDAVVDKRVTVNDVLGLYIESKHNGNRLFFACSGFGAGTSWGSRGSHGYYWSASFVSDRDAQQLHIYSGGVNQQSTGFRFNGCAVRPVW